MEKLTTQNRVRFKIGDIEFEAEGDSEVIARERNEFVSTLLPLAVEAMVRTKGVAQSAIDINEANYKSLPQSSSLVDSTQSIDCMDLKRVSLVDFITTKGVLTNNDFILCAAYFDEKKRGALNFTIENVKKYYDEARKPTPKNISVYLRQLAKNGLIIDLANSPKIIPKEYKLSDFGLDYVEKMKPKVDKKGRKVSAKSRKSRQKMESVFSGINIDELNLNYYPSVKSFKGFKEKMLLVLYIIRKEKKLEWFTTSDVIFLMTDIFGEAVTEAQVKSIFKREKLWFKVENIEGSGKAKKRKLLNGGIDFAKKIIAKPS